MYCSAIAKRWGGNYINDRQGAVACLFEKVNEMSLSSLPSDERQIRKRRRFWLWLLLGLAVVS